MFFEIQEKIPGGLAISHRPSSLSNRICPVNVCLAGSQALRQNARGYPFDLFIGLILFKIAPGHGTNRK
jgi:hypothetical protein